MDAGDARFIADSMLGRLATWLRILGYDTLYFRDAQDGRLVALARREGRILLTRDTRLLMRRRLLGRDAPHAHGGDGAGPMRVIFMGTRHSPSPRSPASFRRGTR